MQGLKPTEQVELADVVQLDTEPRTEYYAAITNNCPLAAYTFGGVTFSKYIERVTPGDKRRPVESPRVLLTESQVAAVKEDLKRYAIRYYRELRIVDGEKQISLWKPEQEREQMPGHFRTSSGDLVCYGQVHEVNEAPKPGDIPMSNFICFQPTESALLAMRREGEVSEKEELLAAREAELAAREAELTERLNSMSTEGQVQAEEVAKLKAERDEARKEAANAKRSATSSKNQAEKLRKQLDEQEVAKAQAKADAKAIEKGRAKKGGRE